MNLNKFTYNDTTTWYWSLANVSDIPDMVVLAQSHFQREITGLLTADELFYAYNLDKALTNQRHNLSVEQLITAKDKTTNKLLAYAWIGRGSRAPYSQDELAEAKILHIDLEVTARQRIAIIVQTLSHWTNWAKACEIPVLVSTTIRADQSAFMRIHEDMGFTVRGAIAYKRLS
jgi:hypothetical protein